MQTDAANFEALAFMCRCYEPGCEVKIDFAPAGWMETIRKDKVVFNGWSGEFGKNTSGCNAYLRFLYRAYVFGKAYDWATYTNEAKKEIDRFVALLKTSKPSNNIPDKMAEYKHKKGYEHELEAKLTYSDKGRQHLSDIYNRKTGAWLEIIHNQLPNGLFDTGLSKKSSESKRIFTTGFYDIWGIDSDGNFCIFELKKPGNNKMGVLSELLFYAEYAYYVLLNKERLHEPSQHKNYRGYEDLYKAVHDGKINSIKALFLLAEGDGHRYINKNITNLLDEMNQNSMNIKFDFLYYSKNEIDLIDRSELKGDIVVL